MKPSKIERRIFKQQLQHGFIQTWLAESRARKEKRHSEPQKAKSGLQLFAFWKCPVQPIKSPTAIVVAKAATSSK